MIRCKTIESGNLDAHVPVSYAATSPGVHSGPGLARFRNHGRRSGLERVSGRMKRCWRIPTRVCPLSDPSTLPLDALLGTLPVLLRCLYSVAGDTSMNPVR